MKIEHENLGVEVLRCGLMFLIVLMHVATFCATGNPSRARLIHVFCIFAVNAFVLISGWFGVRFRVKKVLKMLGLGAFAATVLFLLSPLSDCGWQFAYSLGWFGNCYLALLCCAPLINAAIEALARESMRALMSAWSAYAALMVVSWLPIWNFGINLHVPGWEGHSFNQLCFMYVTGRLLAKCGWINTISRGRLAFGAVALMLCNYAWAIATGLTRGSEFWQGILVGTRGNNNPLIIALSVCVFLWFLRTRVPAWLGRVASLCGPSMFSIYLLHEACNHDLSVSLYDKYFAWAHGGPVYVQYAVIFSVAALVYLTCLGIDLVRRGVFATLQRKGETL